VKIDLNENAAIALIICAVAVIVYGISGCLREVVKHPPQSSSVACVKAGGTWNHWGYCEKKPEK